MASPSDISPSHALFASIVQNSDALMCLCDHEGNFIYTNPAFEKKLSLPEQTQTSFDEFFTSTPWAKICQPGNWQGEATTKDGLWFRTTLSIAANPNTDEVQYVLILQDITEQKEQEKSHYFDQQKLKSILDNIPAYVFSKDKEGKYTYVNKMLSMLLALQTDDILGKTDFDLFTQEAAQNFAKNDKAVFTKGKTIRALEDGGIDEYGIERSYLSVKCPLENEQGEIDEMLGMSVDISEQQRLEKALWESQEKLNSILDNLKARVYIKDRDLKYTYANEELCQTLQKDRSSIIGKDDYDLFEPETAIGFRTTDQEVFKNQRKVSRMETSLEPESKKKRYFLSVKVPLLNAEGHAHSLLGISTDITEQKRLEKRLLRNEKQLTTILDNLKAHVYIKDVSSTYTYVNANMCEYLGKEADEIIGKTDVEIFGKKVSDRFRKSDRDVFDYGEQSSSIEKSRHFQTGERCYFLSIKAPLVNDLGNPYALIGISTDVTEQKRLENELRTLASTDVLTGINNRRFFLELCEKEIERAQRYSKKLSLIMLDVDHFKRINDTYGHAVGDEAIRAMTGLCRKCLRNTDIMGRIGGEEFAILLPETDKKGAIHIAERIRQSTQDYAFDIGEENPVSFTASFGLTSLEDGDKTPDDMLKRADIALYDAKTLGRNRVSEST
ncbi:putative Diguanylate cyclase [Candidatus Terasakiella magnetica]|uniref:Putative Diguanylate cyclase n=1 Tax=Candidatus Terasakiella magnetica TaxID=1867952 RepID=A0A1C3RGT9_9PROT|nr:PAS domain-containing protein [Candidatus Terasakiella magnetica]SCA56402.1 putative Diguanylate cyclase [Candidatus Terasakiella magnetica]